MRLFLLVGCFSAAAAAFANAIRADCILVHRGVATHMNAGGPGEDLSMFTVAQLKVRLRAAGLPVSGKKSELVERLSATANPVHTARTSEGTAFPPVAMQGNNPIATTALTSETMEEGAARRSARRAKLSKYIEEEYMLSIDTALAQYAISNTAIAQRSSAAESEARMAEEKTARLKHEGAAVIARREALVAALAERIAQKMAAIGSMEQVGTVVPVGATDAPDELFTRTELGGHVVTNQAGRVISLKRVGEFSAALPGRSWWEGTGPRQ